jgi:16S rRNA (cytidine1402-2'-O)-methyltransferase
MAEGQRLAAGALFLVPTPLGDLGDITRRAVDVLAQADLVACEDTRRTLGLLNHLGLAKPLWSYHAHSPRRRPLQILDALSRGKRVAVVSDAGTPGLSDPGTELVQAALTAGHPVVPLPGPCAAVTALVASGLPTDRFFFIGFLPRRPARARRTLAQAADTGATVALYESPYRTLETVRRIAAAAGPETPVVIARELTKIHEEFLRGTAAGLIERFSQKAPVGEVVILFRRRLPSEDEP